MMNLDDRLIPSFVNLENAESEYLPHPLLVLNVVFELFFIMHQLISQAILSFVLGIVVIFQVEFLVLKQAVE